MWKLARERGLRPRESSPARASAVAHALNLANFAGIMKIYLIKYAKFANNSFEMGV